MEKMVSCREIKQTVHYANIALSVCFVCLGLEEAVRGLLQLYGFLPSAHHLFRLTGSFYNPGPYGGFLGMVLPVAVWLAVGRRHQILTYFGWLSVVIILLVLPATMSRAGWLSAIAGSAVVLVARYRIRLRKWQWAAVCIVGIAALTGAYLMKKDSADGRLLIWKLSVETIANHPHGVGWGRFAPAYGETQAAYFAAGRGSAQEQWVAGNPEHAFNEFLHIGVELGVWAMLGFVVAVVGLGVCFVRLKQWGWLGALIAFVVFANFSYPLHSLQPNRELHSLFEQAKQFEQYGKHEDSNQLLKQAVAMSCDPMLYNIMGKNYQAMKDYPQAEACFLKAAHLVPNRIYPYYLLALLYKETGQTDKMRAAAHRVLTQQPKVMSPAVEEMRETVRKFSTPIQ